MAADFYRKAANLGSSVAFNWTGVTVDMSKAFEYYKKAADMNDTGGLFRLALCYKRGTGVNKDKHKAIDFR